MTTMKRVTVALPDEIDRLVYETRKKDEFTRCSYSEIIRRALDIGLAAICKQPTNTEKTDSLADQPPTASQ